MFTALLSTFLFLAKPIMLEQEMKKGNCRNIGRILNDSSALRQHECLSEEQFYCATFRVNQPVSKSIQKYNYFLFSTQYQIWNSCHIIGLSDVESIQTTLIDGKQIKSFQKKKNDVAISVIISETTKDSHWVSITIFANEKQCEKPRQLDGFEALLLGELDYDLLKKPLTDR